MRVAPQMPPQIPRPGAATAVEPATVEGTESSWMQVGVQDKTQRLMAQSKDIRPDLSHKDILRDMG